VKGKAKRTKEKEMKCVICKSSDIQNKMIEEEIKFGKDIILIPLNVLVCMNCGERYYDRNTMRKIEDVRSRLKQKDLEVEEVGKVLRAV
jgi:YgiT-type zinc finger domain-containing protein